MTTVEIILDIIAAFCLFVLIPLELIIRYKKGKKNE